MIVELTHHATIFRDAGPVQRQLKPRLIYDGASGSYGPFLSSLCRLSFAAGNESLGIKWYKTATPHVTEDGDIFLCFIDHRSLLSRQA